RRAMLETLARIRLAQGSLNECESLISEMESRVSTQEDWLLYTQRHSAVTRAQLLSRQGHDRKALKNVHLALQLAEKAHDHYLARTALIEKLHILQRLNRLDECVEMFASTLNVTPDDSPELYAR